MMAVIFSSDHDVVGVRGFANAANEDDGEQHHDDEGRPVEAEVPAGAVEWVALEVGEARRKVCGSNPTQIRVNTEPIEQVDDVRGEPNADGHVGDGIFQDQIPADDPGDQFAHRGVGVGVRAARDGDHGGEFGVAEGGECADDAHQHEG